MNSDTLFKEDFSLSKVKARFVDLQAKCEDCCLLLSYECKEEGEYEIRLSVQHYGILLGRE